MSWLSDIVSDPIDAAAIERAKEILHDARLKYYRSEMSAFHVQWGSREDERDAFRIANKRARVGSAPCRPCHIKAWTCLHLIVQEASE